MFTGIVQAVGSVERAIDLGGLRRLVINTGDWAHRPRLGDSIAINGCCLTVAQPPGDTLEFDAVPETLAKTTLGRLIPGSPVNLEHAATPTTFLDGHVVQGHVDGLSRVVAVHTGSDYRVVLSPPHDLMQYLSPKGSVCLDGVSLTIVDLDPAGGTFGVAIIPTTLARTTLRSLKPGDLVNTECDAMVKAVVHWLRHYGEPGS